MNIFRELLLEASTLSNRLKAIYDGAKQGRVDRAQAALDKLEQAIKDDKIFNVDFGEIKDTLTRALEDVLRHHLDSIGRDEKDWDNSPHMMVYKADINTMVYLNQAKGQARKIKTFLDAHKDFPAADRTKLEKALAANEAAAEINDMLTKLKPKIIKGRKPSEKEADPNTFHRKLGSAEAQKIVKDKLEAGIKEPLDAYEEAVREWLQGMLDSISKNDTYVQPVDRQHRDPLLDRLFFQCFDAKKDYDASDKEKTVYKDVKLTKKDYAKTEAKAQRDGIERRYLKKNIEKLSHIIDLKGNLTKIKELPTKKPSVKSGSGTVESGFSFEFEDGSSFKVVNKVITKYSFTGKQFEQFPMTFHDVKFPDGSKMKNPSEEKMVTQFAQK